MTNPETERLSGWSRRSGNPKKGPLRIALVANSSWNIYNFRLGLVQRLQEQGIEVHVIAPHDHFSGRLMASGATFHNLPLAMYGTNPFKEWLVVFFLIRLYRQFSFDFIFHYTAKPNIYGTLAAAYCRIPSIAVTTGLGLLRDEEKGWSRRILLGLYRLAARLTRELWFLNADDRDFFLKRGLVSAEKTRLLPSEGVNTEWFQPSYTPENRPGRAIRLLYAGRLVWSKGLWELYEAALYFKRRGRNVRFHLVGFLVPDHPDAIPESVLQTWRRRRVLRYHGETEDIRPYIQGADCIVLPSYSEGGPRVLLEAASMGKPIIATDAPGCREVVHEGVNGFLCRVKDSQDLIRQIERFLELSPAERRQMGMAGRAKVLAEFDEERVADGYMETLKRYLQIPGTRLLTAEISVCKPDAKQGKGSDQGNADRKTQSQS